MITGSNHIITMKFIITCSEQFNDLPHGQWFNCLPNWNLEWNRHYPMSCLTVSSLVSSWVNTSTLYDVVTTWCTTWIHSRRHGLHGEDHKVSCVMAFLLGDLMIKYDHGIWLWFSMNYVYIYIYICILYMYMYMYGIFNHKLFVGNIIKPDQLFKNCPSLTRSHLTPTYFWEIQWRQDLLWGISNGCSNLQVFWVVESHQMGDTFLRLWLMILSFIDQYSTRRSKKWIETYKWFGVWAPILLPHRPMVGTMRIEIFEISWMRWWLLLYSILLGYHPFMAIFIGKTKINPTKLGLLRRDIFVGILWISSTIPTGF